MSDSAGAVEHKLGMDEFGEAIEDLRDLADRMEENGHVAGIAAPKRLEHIREKINHCYHEEMEFVREDQTEARSA